VSKSKISVSKSQTKIISEGTESPLGAEELAFRRQRPQLMKRYAGQYVAFHRGRLIDRDKDDEALAARLFKKLGDAAFYIGRLEETPTICEVPSPELAN
jgi:hypothetical protein